MTDTLEYVNRQIRRLAKQADQCTDVNHAQFIRDVCAAALAVSSHEGKLAAYSLIVAALDGAEGLKTFLALVGEWIAVEEAGDATPDTMQ